MSAWNLVYEEWKPSEQPRREALCALGNGRFVTRGAAPEADAGGIHYPGTYIAGGYDRSTSAVAGRQVENEDLVNWPNWLPVGFRPVEGRWLDLEDLDVLEFRQELDLRRGLLERRVRVRDGEGRTSTISTRRLVSMARPELAAIEWTLVPEDWSGEIVVRSEIDGNVRNAGVARYRDLVGEHVEILETLMDGEEVGCLVCCARQSRLRVAQAIRNRLEVGAEEPRPRRDPIQEPLRVGHQFTVAASAGARIRLEKVCAVHTGRDHATSEPALEARHAVDRAGSFEELLHEHALAWERLWELCDIQIDGDESVQRAIRVHLLHLLQTTSLNTIGMDVGVPARGWHGEAYRGHIFWDELFILPCLTLRIPELARALLMYRVRRLDAARRAAAAAGHAGAMFPWQSGSNGREESQFLHLNPRSGRWIPDETHLQRHIGIAIAYCAWQYFQATRDEEFLSFHGAELILEIARFFGSLATFDQDKERYVIRGVVGPDEFHTRLPGSDEPGLPNNAYTNVMAAWTLRCAQRVLDALPESGRRRLRRDLGLSDEVVSRWDEVSRRLFVPMREDGIIEQFEGYFGLQELDWDGYRRRYGDIHRVDRILESEGDSPNRYQAGKQADVLMLFYLLSAEELAQLFGRLDYPFDPEWIPRNIDYYQARTSHGSTLSRVVSAWVLARSHREQSWACFAEALRSDLDDVQGGTTAEGIHLGAMAGTVDLLQRCYTGLELRDETLWLAPQLPEHIEEIRFPIRFRGHALSLSIDRAEVRVSSSRGGPLPVRVAIHGEPVELSEGQTITASLQEKSR